MSGEILHIPVGLDLAAVAVGAVGGAAAATVRAAAERIDVLGVVIVGFVTGLGGSLLRDVLLGAPPAALRSDRYLLVTVLAAGAGMVFAHLVVRVEIAVLLLDAVSIGLYLTLGITKAEHAGLPVGSAVLVGLVACSGGGLLRDLLLGDPIGLIRVGSWYVTAALGAAAIFLLARPWSGSLAATIAAVVVAAGLRILALGRSWTSPLARPVIPPVLTDRNQSDSI
ncbi:TRIC cation channel family protein [Nocardia yamanashiensis]|uniref:trimeric intracellular cation channel family protein n=1 Tax=Nocardia yamanashiensis TaxID=209247 RepID=UPI001E4F989F|nr:TRIC cation channel family protein [Nocardia yamanashiensis]UGT43471.1 TRIC cation channel family protein [Nocardia yamanashiensis]